MECAELPIYVDRVPDFVCLQEIAVQPSILFTRSQLLGFPRDSSSRMRSHWAISIFCRASGDGSNGGLEEPDAGKKAVFGLVDLMLSVRKM